VAAGAFAAGHFLLVSFVVAAFFFHNSNVAGHTGGELGAFLGVGDFEPGVDALVLLVKVVVAAGGASLGVLLLAFHVVAAGATGSFVGGVVENGGGQIAFAVFTLHVIQSNAVGGIGNSGAAVGVQVGQSDSAQHGANDACDKPILHDPSPVRAVLSQRK
jgi:hypothetical protein